MLNIPQEKLTAIKNFAHQYIFKLLCQQDIPFILAHLDPQLIGIGASGRIVHSSFNNSQAGICPSSERIKSLAACGVS